MFIFSQPEIRQLFKNSQPDETGKDHYPVAKLYLPRTGCVWLVTEIDLDAPGRILALYDLRQGVITYDYTDLDFIAGLRNIEKQKVIRDPYFVGKYPMSVYMRTAFALGYITEIDVLLGKSGPAKPSGPQ